MTNNNISKTLLAKIEERAKQRFSCTSSGDAIDKIQSLASSELTDCGVILLRRTVNQGSGYRTLLVAALESENKLHAAVTWAAEVRASLLEPEAADLYLFLSIQDITDDVAARIESSEQFCRKYVTRADVDFINTLDRSFLAAPYGSKSAETTKEAKTSETGLADPLSNSFIETERVHPWFDAKEQQEWRSILLSGNTGRDLAEQLLTGLITVDDI